ncbi:MAG: DUF2071 domain-containing protein [Chitinophagaceae bacterium]|nr:DUF2071 domain-containing protein [Chitinophagaceae bacterium]
MNLLKRIPIHYKGELHDVRLVNFSVDINELKDRIPSTIKIRNFNGRAMISMVDVRLRKMRPVFFPLFKFNYRHIAFRVLVDDSEYNAGTSKGIFFYRSFTDNLLIVSGGRMLTDYNLESAHIEENESTVTISKGNNFVKYCFDNSSVEGDDKLLTAIGSLDRAYSMLGDSIRVTIIQREKWPIKPVSCSRFENTFFKTARLEGMFRVFETIYYDWLPPTKVTS